LGIAAGAFGFDKGEGLTVVAPEDVIDEAGAGVVGHSDNWKLSLGSAPLTDREFPACFFKKEVNEVVAGLGFGIVVSIDLGDLGGFGLGDFDAELLKLGIEGGVLVAEFG
jgi:hypothetical protein